MYSEIKKCRVSESRNLITVLSLGEQCLSGIFPKTQEENVTKGPVDLVWCPDSGLLQLKQTYNIGEMYGESYGYRSGLNSLMKRHLEQKVRKLESFVGLSGGDLVLDIGSNDGTLLKAYSEGLRKVGIDPTGSKFKQYYSEDSYLIPDFFSRDVFLRDFPDGNAKIITSIAMFYDLESPLSFARDVERCLADDGVWHFEQSYLPSMLRTNGYDTICHEHLEFYSLKVVKEIVEACGMRVVDVEMNSVNGGSFAVTACKRTARYVSNDPVISWLLKQEDDMGLDTPKVYRDFEDRVFRHRRALVELVESLVASGKKILGYGASTKGNVLLQFCKLSAKEIPYIAEVNIDKFGHFTPGTGIPIVSEREAMAMKPDYLLVLPWHFKAGILEREKEYLAKGGKFIFPLPEIEIV